ncbi:hypothetical protein AAHC03_05015 [Spirometra sp. Aus1]
MDPESAFQDAVDCFTLCNFQECLKGLHSINSTDPQIRQKVELLTYRAYIAQRKYNVVINEITENHEVLSYRLVRLLAGLQSGIVSKEKVLEDLSSNVSDDLLTSDETSLIIAATMYMYLAMPEKALRVLHRGSTLFCDALTVQCLLSINRSDLAGKTVRRMQVADEDALPSQLASAAFYLAKGGDKLNEALSIYQELQEKYKPTPLLLNGQAAALMSMGRWADAEPVLQQSLDLEPSHAETLINMMVVSQHTGKPAEIVNRFISQLRDCDKNHPFLDAINGTDQLFEEAKSQISVKIQKNVGSVKA